MNVRLSIWLLIVAAIATATPLRAGVLDDIQEANSNLFAAFQDQGAINFTIVESALARRRGLIAQLIAEDPQAVKSVALPADLVDRLKLAVPNAGSWIEEEGDWTGNLEVLAVMDLKFENAKTRRFLRLPNGRVEMFGGAKTFHHTDSLGGATLHIHGIRSEGVIAVDSIQTAAAPAPITTVGVQNIAVIVVTSPGNPTFPAPWNVSTPTLLSMIANSFFGSSGRTLNTFWQEASYGVTSAQGKVYGPFVVPNYTCTGVADTEILRQNAIAAAAASIDLTQYNRYAIVFPNNACAYGGTAGVGPAKYQDLPLVSSVSWYPIFAGQSVAVTVRVLCHEMGHNLGMNHGNSEDYGAIPVGAPGSDGASTEYGDVYNIMGAGGEAGGLWQYSAQPMAQILGWLDSTSYKEVTSPGTFTISPLEGKIGTRALRVLRPVGPGLIPHWMWIESRQASGDLDSDLPPVTTTPHNVYSGALIHDENPDLDPLHSYLLDFNPVKSPNNFFNSAMTVGQSWSDPGSMLNLTVNAIGSGTVTVTVGYDTPCATLAISGGPFPLAGGSGTITVKADVACSWSASTPDNWITLGTTSGQGNGSVSFTVSPNSTAGQRNGSITVQRQSFGVAQAGPGVSAISVTPNMGSGFASSFTFVVANTKGYTDFDYVNGNFAKPGHNLCYFSFQRAGTIYLNMPDSGSQFAGTVTVSRPGTSVSNGVCTIFSDGSSVSGSGDYLTLTVNIQFTGAETGEFAINVQPHTSAGYTGPFLLGVWDVQAPPSVITSVSTASGGPDIAQNTFVVLQGTNLVPKDTPADGVIWSSAASFASGQMPTQLNGVSVTVNKKPAFIYFFCGAVTSSVCTSDQINLLTPLDSFTGSVPIVVTYTNSSGTTTSLTYTANLKTVAPALLLFSQSYVAATHSDGTLVGPTTLYPGASTPAKAGEQIVLYGVGFGLPSTTLVNGSSSQSGALSKLPVCTVEKNPAAVAFAGLISPGLYQLNLTVPNGSSSGDNPITCTYGGGTTLAGDLIAVGQ